MLEASIADEDLIRCLELSPDLVQLEVFMQDDSGYPNEILPRLTDHEYYPNGRACLAPKLQILKLSHNADFDMDTFIDLVQSRWRIGGDANALVQRIKTVEVQYIDEDNPPDTFGDQWGRLYAFKMEGLEIDMCLYGFKEEGLEIVNHGWPNEGLLGKRDLEELSDEY
jgi:hypothetical protein